MPSHQIEPYQHYIYPIEDEDEDVIEDEPYEEEESESEYSSISSDDHKGEQDDGGEADDEAEEDEFLPNFPVRQRRAAQVIQPPAPPAEVFKVTLYYEQMVELSQGFVGGVMKINIGSTNLAQEVLHPREAQTAGILARRNPRMLHGQGRDATESMSGQAPFNIGNPVGRELATTVGILVNLNTSITRNRSRLRRGQSLTLSAQLLRYGAVARQPVTYPNGSTPIADLSKRLLLQKIILLGFFIQNTSEFAGLAKTPEYHDVIGRCIMALVWESVLVPVEPTCQLASAIGDLEQFLARFHILRHLPHPH